MKRVIIPAVTCGLVLALIGCAAGPQGPYLPENLAGFWAGFWHGLIALVTFIVSLFTEVKIYSANNTGWPYDLGFLLGLACWLGGGTCSWRRGRKRGDKEDWDEAAEKMEAKIKRHLREWVEDEAEDEEEWSEVKRKVEGKIRRILKDWAEK